MLYPEKNPIEKKEFINLDSIMKNLPEVLAGKNLWQNEFHEFDVYEHTIKFVEHLKELESEDEKLDPHLLAAGWLHDIGKPIVAKPKEKDGVAMEREPGKPYHEFTDHEIVGAEMVRKMDPALFKKLELEQEKIALLVYCHYLPMKGIKEMRNTKNWGDFLQKYEDLKKKLEEMDGDEKTARVSKKEILFMFLADKLAQGDPNKYCTDQGELFAIRDAILSENKDLEKSTLEEIYQLQKNTAEKNKQYALKK